jgi:hypothetical protein
MSLPRSAVGDLRPPGLNAVADRGDEPARCEEFEQMVARAFPTQR